MGYIEFETSENERVFLSLSEIEGVYEVREGENKYCEITSRYKTYSCLSYDEIIRKIRDVEIASLDKFIRFTVVNSNNCTIFNYRKASTILSIDDYGSFRTVMFDNGDTLDVEETVESILGSVGYKRVENE